MLLVYHFTNCKELLYFWEDLEKIILTLKKIIVQKIQTPTCTAKNKYVKDLRTNHSYDLLNELLQHLTRGEKIYTGNIGNLGQC